MSKTSRPSGFSVTDLATYEWPVDVKVPFVNDDGEGEFETRRFTGKFKHLALDEANALFAKLQERFEGDQEQPVGAGEVAAMHAATRVANYQIDLYMEIWLGWGDDLTGADGQPLPHSDDTRRQLLNQRLIREAVIEAHKSSQGGEAVRAKN